MLITHHTTPMFLETVVLTAIISVIDVLLWALCKVWKTHDRCVLGLFSMEGLLEWRTEMEIEVTSDSSGHHVHCSPWYDIISDRGKAMGSFKSRFHRIGRTKVNREPTSWRSASFFFFERYLVYKVLLSGWHLPKAHGLENRRASPTGEHECAKRWLSSGFSNLTHQIIWKGSTSTTNCLKRDKHFQKPRWWLDKLCRSRPITLNQTFTKTDNWKCLFPSREAVSAVLCSSVNDINSPDNLCWGAFILWQPLLSLVVTAEPGL